jgi:hypothetical protein
MEILTYPIGLVIGLLPVLTNPGSDPRPATLYLDGREACTITIQAQGCNVDLGAQPRIHLLELVRRDAKGHIVERARRWVNRPGQQAEAYLRGACTSDEKTCDLSIGWGHPSKLSPLSFAVTVNGETVNTSVTNALTINADTTRTPAVVSIDIIFPDGRRASQTRAFGATYQGSAQTTLLPVPISPPETEKNLPAELKTLAGFPVRAVEDAPKEIVWVVEPGALAGFLTLNFEGGGE